MTNNHILRFSLPYFLFAICLFIIEVLIAKYTGGWVRGYLGDFLVVGLVYASIKTVLNIKTNIAILSTLIFAYSVEISQYFKLAELLGFTKGSIPYIVLGNTFSIEDLVCYILGCLWIFMIEKAVGTHSQTIKKHA